MTALAQLMKQLISMMLRSAGRDPRTTACGVGAALALGGVEMGWWDERLGWVGAVALVVVGLLLAGDSGEEKGQMAKGQMANSATGPVRDVEDMR